MKTTFIILGIALVLAGFAFVAFFPKLAVAPVNLLSKAISEYRMAKLAKEHERTCAAFKETRDKVDIYVTIPALVAQSPYDADYAYRDAAYNLTEMLVRRTTPDTVYVLPDFDSTCDTLLSRIRTILSDSLALRDAAAKVKALNTLVSGDTAKE